MLSFLGTLKPKAIVMAKFPKQNCYTTEKFKNINKYNNFDERKTDVPWQHCDDKSVAKRVNELVQYEKTSWIGKLNRKEENMIVDQVVRWGTRCLKMKC